MLISELPNTPDYPLRVLAELRARESNPGQTIARVGSDFEWTKTPEKHSFWSAVDQGKHPYIPASSIEDLRRAGMLPESSTFPSIVPLPTGPETFATYDTPMPEPEKNIPTPTLVSGPIITHGRIKTDTPPLPFYCVNSESTEGPCAKQCAECDVDERKYAKRKPSITLEDYARMERENEAITSPGHYKVCEGLEVVDMIRAVLTPEQFRGYCLGNVIKYRMRAGKKTMSPMEDLGKAHVYEQWLKEMERGED